MARRRHRDKRQDRSKGLTRRVCDSGALHAASVRRSCGRIGGVPGARLCRRQHRRRRAGAPAARRPRSARALRQQGGAAHGLGGAGRRKAWRRSVDALARRRLAAGEACARIGRSYLRLIPCGPSASRSPPRRRRAGAVRIYGRYLLSHGARRPVRPSVAEFFRAAAARGGWRTARSGTALAHFLRVHALPLRRATTTACCSTPRACTDGAGEIEAPYRLRRCARSSAAANRPSTNCAEIPFYSHCHAGERQRIFTGLRASWTPARRYDVQS